MPTVVPRTYTFDQAATATKLHAFFVTNGAKAQDFGNRVCQTYEALTFAQVIKWYKVHGWTVALENPTTEYGKQFKLKFSTRGLARNFTYAACIKAGEDPIQIRHQIRVATFAEKERKRDNPEAKKKKSAKSKPPRANVVCDVAVLHDAPHGMLEEGMHVYNRHLITFAEAKHMDAYAELVAGFIGLAHELQPWRIGPDRKKLRAKYASHPKPFLNISGHALGTALGIKRTIKERKFDIELHDSTSPFIQIATPPPAAPVTVAPTAPAPPSAKLVPKSRLPARLAKKPRPKATKPKGK